MENNNKRKVASALKYAQGSDVAPKVVAKGLGLVAENIIKKADESNIPVYQDETLANQLYNLSLGNEIPPELYNAVAEVLVFISSIDRKGGK